MLNADELFATIIEGARKAAGDYWAETRDFSVNACWSIASQLALLGQGYTSGEFSQQEVKSYVETLRLQFIGLLAATIMKVEGLAERLVNGALTAARDALNTALGFKLIA
ncbi:MAG: hypothetical protein ACOH2N_06070 [Devosia sp.]|jgi:hypothetical protein